MISALKPREAEVVGMYFGLDDDTPLTLEQIGKRLRLTRERVRQIKEQALRRLRRQASLEKWRQSFTPSHAAFSV